MTKLDRWMKAGKYLPVVMRDFHDQKDLFKALHDLVAVEKHSYAGKIDWVTGQCYVIDIFLWWMAKHGYTLQRMRADLPFRDLEADIQHAKIGHPHAGKVGEEIIAPAECDESCDDPECPYSHKPLTLRQAYENALVRLRAAEAATAAISKAGGAS